jgi:hypothetical protein
MAEMGLTPNRSLESTGVRLLSKREGAMGRHIGIDLHKNMIVVCIIEPGDETGVTDKCGLMTHLKAVVSNIKVVNPYRLKVIRTSTKKTDKYDAHALANFLSTGMLPTVRQKDERYLRIESLARTRSCLVK